MGDFLIWWSLPNLAKSPNKNLTQVFCHSVWSRGLEFVVFVQLVQGSQHSVRWRRVSSSLPQGMLCPLDYHRYTTMLPSRIKFMGESTIQHTDCMEYSVFHHWLLIPKWKCNEIFYYSSRVKYWLQWYPSKRDTNGTIGFIFHCGIKIFVLEISMYNYFRSYQTPAIYSLYIILRFTSKKNVV